MFFLHCCSISSFFQSAQDKMLRVFDPRAQLTPVQVSPLFRPSQPCQNSLQRGNQTQLFLTHTAFSHSGMRRAIYTCLKPSLRCSFVPPRLGVVINMLTVNQFTHHWPLTAVHLLLIYGCAPQAAISAALFPRVPRPHAELAPP